MRKLFASTMFAAQACGRGARAGAFGAVNINPVSRPHRPATTMKRSRGDRHR